MLFVTSAPRKLSTHIIGPAFVTKSHKPTGLDDVHFLLCDTNDDSSWDQSVMPCFSPARAEKGFCDDVYLFSLIWQLLISDCVLHISFSKRANHATCNVFLLYLFILFNLLNTFHIASELYSRF